MKHRDASGRRLQYHLYHLLWQGIDLLLPPTCGGCGTRGYRWCPACRGAVVQPPLPLCRLCGQPVTSSAPTCDDCRAHPPGFSGLRSWSLFVHPTRGALHALKYRGDMGLAEALVPQLAVFASCLEWDVDILIPVPLSRERLSQRGYNQAGLISMPLSLAVGIRHAPGALRRTRETPSQVGMSWRERHENVRGAFVASPRLVRGRSILLLDDVATTGATLSSCADALFAAGARAVFAMTVARAYRDRGDGKRLASSEPA